MTGPDGDLSSPALPGNSRRAVQDPLSQLWMCSQCRTSGHSKLFQSRQAANGHMQVHTKLAKKQAEGGASSSAVVAQRKKIHEDLVFNKKPPDVHEEPAEEQARTSLNLGQKAEAESRKKKRKEEVSYAWGMFQSRSPIGKQSKSHQASFGPMCADNNQPQRLVLKLGQCNLNKMEGRETKRDGSAVAEGGASLSAAEARGKKIHLKLDLNKDAPEDDERETKGDGSAVAEGGASLSEAEARRKKIHMKLDLNKDAPEDDETDDEEGA